MSIVRNDPIAWRSSSDGDPSLVMASVVLGVALLAAWLHPHPLVLLVLSTVLVLGALTHAAFVAVRHARLLGLSRGGALVDKLQMPGVVMFFGFAAAMIGDPDAAVLALSRER